MQYWRKPIYSKSVTVPGPFMESSSCWYLSTHIIYKLSADDGRIIVTNNIGSMYVKG